MLHYSGTLCAHSARAPTYTHRHTVAAHHHAAPTITIRLAPFFMYLLCGVALFLPAGGGEERKLLQLVPKGVVYGILTFVGVAGVLPESGNQLSKRALLLFSFPSEYPKSAKYTGSTPYRMHLFTFFQAMVRSALCAVLCALCSVQKIS